jgi:hypothetical protein
MNLILVASLADRTSTSPDSRTNLPGKRFAVSFPGIAKFFTNSVVTAIPDTVL